MPKRDNHPIPPPITESQAELYTRKKLGMIINQHRGRMLTLKGKLKEALSIIASQEKEIHLLKKQLKANKEKAASTYEVDLSKVRHAVHYLKKTSEALQSVADSYLPEEDF